MNSLARWLMFVTALLSPFATAAAQDFRSGLSAYDTGDYARAFYDWIQVAERGDAKAQAAIAFLYHHGLGVLQDDAQAATWSIRAAEQGQAEAQLMLGTLAFFGQGVPRSYVSAYAWCEIAETNGQSDAQECRDAALEHMTSEETKQSFRLVAEWFSRHRHGEQ